jgi:hypothetical protein
MISAFQKILSSLYSIVDLPTSSASDLKRDGVYEVEWKMVFPNDKMDGFAVFAGFASPMSKNGEVNLKDIVAAFDVVDNESQTGRVILQLEQMNTAFEKGHIKLAQPKDRTITLLKLKR